MTGGTVNGAGSLQFLATRVGADTTLAQIIRMVEEARAPNCRSRGWSTDHLVVRACRDGDRGGDRAGLAVFRADPALMALVAGVGAHHRVPCAMGLTSMVGTGRAAEMGVLFRKGDALQQLDPLMWSPSTKQAR